MNNYSEIDELSNFPNIILLNYGKWFTSSKYFVYIFRSLLREDYDIKNIKFQNKNYNYINCDAYPHLTFNAGNILSIGGGSGYGIKCPGTLYNKLSDDDKEEFVKIYDVLKTKYKFRF